MVISAGALLKDNQTGKVLAQLKIKNIDSKTVKAVTVRINMLDAANKSLGDTVEYQYLDLSVSRDMEFGQKIPIMLPDRTARAFSVSVVRVIFFDNSEWTGNEDPSVWVPLALPVELEQSLKDKELVKEYKLKYGQKCQYVPVQHQDLWICSCGRINHANETKCSNCVNTLSGLLAVDFAELEKSKKARLEQESIRNAQIAAEKERLAKRRRITAAIVIPICIAIFAGIWYVATIPDRVIAKAEELASQGEYMEAVELLDGLNDSERTWEIREEYIEAMEDQIRDAIYRNAYSEAVALIKEYTVLDTTESFLQRVQNRCGHSYVVTKNVDNTCTEDGYMDRKCSVCEHEKHEVLKARGHNNSTKIVKEATCTEAGLKVTTCSTCGNATETSIAMIAHSYKDTISKKPTCTAMGVRVSTCTACGKSNETPIDMVEHSYKEKTVKNPTCTEKGSKQSICAVCGNSLSAVAINALGHSYQQSVKKQAGCTTDGIRLIKCSRCQNSYEETISATGHSWKNATCTTPKTCTQCKQTSGNALGHTAGTAKCGRCGVVTFETLHFSGSQTQAVCLDDYVVGSISLPSGQYKITFTYLCHSDMYYPWASLCLMARDGLPINGNSWYYPLKSGETASSICNGPVPYCSIQLNGVYVGSWTLTIEAIG